MEVSKRLLFIIGEIACFAMTNSCTPLDAFYANRDGLLAQEVSKSGNCRDLTFKAPLGTSVRKAFLNKRFLTPARERQRLFWTIDDTLDLKRQVLLNVSQGTRAVSRLKIWINGEQVQTFLPESNLLTLDVPNMVVNLCSYLRMGENTLDVELQGPPDSSIELFIDAFMQPINITGAFFSHESPIFRPETRKGILYIKFLEGMSVRLRPEQALPDQLVDLSGISLYPLKIFLMQNNVSKIEQSFIGTPEAHDTMEKEWEEDGTEQPNRNLMYRLVLDDSIDLQKMDAMASTLLGMPFFEGVGVDNSSSLSSASAIKIFH